MDRGPGLVALGWREIVTAGNSPQLSPEPGRCRRPGRWIPGQGVGSPRYNGEVLRSPGAGHAGGQVTFLSQRGRRGQPDPRAAGQR